MAPARLATLISPIRMSPSVATIATSRTEDLESSGGSQAAALNEGFQAAFLGGALIALLGLVLTLVLIRTRDSRAHVELGTAAAEA
jgi:hypothetical protein